MKTEEKCQCEVCVSLALKKLCVFRWSSLLVPGETVEIGHLNSRCKQKVIFISTFNITYYCGFLSCVFSSPYSSNRE